MATYTSNYAWTKPEGSDPVDIGVLNNNLDSQDSIVHNAYMQLAPVFSTASTYAVDDVVLYSDNLYKCHTAVTIAGDWDATKWTQVKVTDIVGGGGGGGGHTIENASGTAMTQRDALQFKGGLSVSDDSTNDRTVVSDDYELITWADWQTIVENHEENLHPDAIITDVPGADGDVSVDLMKLGWENSDITQSMASGVEMDLSSDDYDMLMILWAYNTSHPERILSNITQKGKGTQLGTIESTTAMTRNLLRTSDTKYTTGIGFKGSTADNTVCIPYRIYLIKTTAKVKINAIAMDVSTSADKCMMADGASVEDNLKNAVPRTKTGTTLATLYTALNALSDEQKSRATVCVNGTYWMRRGLSGVFASSTYIDSTGMHQMQLQIGSATPHFYNVSHNYGTTTHTSTETAVTSWTIYYQGTPIS